MILKILNDFFLVNSVEVDAICIDLHRSTIICLALNLKISWIFSEISRKLRISSCYLKFHMGQVKNWPLRRPWNSGSLGNFWKNFIDFWSEEKSQWVSLKLVRTEYLLHILAGLFLNCPCERSESVSERSELRERAKVATRNCKFWRFKKDPAN